MVLTIYTFCFPLIYCLFYNFAEAQQTYETKKWVTIIEENLEHQYDKAENNWISTKLTTTYYQR